MEKKLFDLTTKRKNKEKERRKESKIGKRKNKEKEEKKKVRLEKERGKKRFPIKANLSKFKYLENLIYNLCPFRDMRPTQFSTSEK